MAQLEQTPAQEPTNDEARTPSRTAPTVERRRLIELGKQLGRLEQRLEQVDQRLAALPGGVPETVRGQWDALRSEIRTSISDVDTQLGTEEIPFAKLEGRLQTHSRSLEIIASLLQPTRGAVEGSGLQLPNFGVQGTPLIVYDAEDVAGVAALSKIIDLAQHPEKSDDLLKQLGLEQRKAGESFGQALQRGMLEHVQKLKGSEEVPTLPPAPTLPRAPGRGVAPEELPRTPVRPDEKGNFIPGGSRNQ